MAPGVDPFGPGRGPDDADIDPKAGSLDRLLRLLEVVIFCCLSALVVFWFADRLRSLNFEPILVSPCAAEDCDTYAGPSGGQPWVQLTRALDERGMTSFSRVDMCLALATLYQTYGAQAEGVEQVSDLMVSRGMVEITREGAVLAVGPGARNDGFFDALRDALSFKATRGCNPMRYGSVFWPLLLAWLALSALRYLRSRQKVWATR